MEGGGLLLSSVQHRRPPEAQGKLLPHDSSSMSRPNRFWFSQDIQELYPGIQAATSCPAKRLGVADVTGGSAVDAIRAVSKWQLLSQASFPWLELAWTKAKTPTFPCDRTRRGCELAKRSSCLGPRLGNPQSLSRAWLSLGVPLRGEESREGGTAWRLQARRARGERHSAKAGWRLFALAQRRHVAGGGRRDNDDDTGLESQSPAALELAPLWLPSRSVGKMMECHGAACIETPASVTRSLDHRAAVGTSDLASLPRKRLPLRSFPIRSGQHAWL